MKLNGYKIVESILLEDDDPDRPGMFKGAGAGAALLAPAGVAAGLAAPHAKGLVDKGVSKLASAAKDIKPGSFAEKELASGAKHLGSAGEFVSRQLAKMPHAGKAGLIAGGVGLGAGALAGAAGYGGHKVKKQVQAF